MIPPTPSDIDQFCTHALLEPIPLCTINTAHWLIANAHKVAAAPQLVAAVRALWFCHCMGVTPTANDWELVRKASYDADDGKGMEETIHSKLNPL